MIDLAETLDAVGLTGKHFALSKKVNGQLKSGCFSTAERGEAWIGDGETDCYITVNPVREGTQGKPTDADIESVHWLLVDCDPKKDSELDPDGTTQERMDAAWTVASGVWEHFEQKGVLVASGRGAQVWLRVGIGVDRRALLGWIREEHSHPLVDVDATHDYSRLCRLPNTVNTRTGELVAIIDEGMQSKITGADVRDLLACWAPPTQINLPDADRDAPSAREVRRYVTGEALSLWREDPMEITRDRSQRDFIFLRLVIARGAPLVVASRLLHALPGAKAADRTDEGYWQSTATAAITALADEKQSDDVIMNVVQRVESDEDYLMQPETIKALAHLYLHDFEKWIVVRGQLKALGSKTLGVGITDLDTAIKRRAAKLTTDNLLPPDDRVVFTRAEDGGKGCWKIRDTKKQWTWATFQEAKMILSSGPGDPEADMALAMTHPFSVGLEPFKSRILPGRVWNESNARFSVEAKEGEHPTWDQLYRVVGRGLDDDLEGSEWARRHKVETGGRYLLFWTGSMLQDPRSRRAYLALFSEEQGTGKSLFFEAHKLLIGKAVCKGNNALTNPRGFNGELANAVLCYTEEIDLGANGRSRLYDKVKDLTLGDTVNLEAKSLQVYEVPNVMSWGQAANSQSYCPVYSGDKRITLFRVESPRDDERMSKDEMLRRLRAEAPAFLYTLLNTAMPAREGRYVVPPIDTAVKIYQSKANETDLQHWIGLNPDWILREMDEIVDAFRAYLDSRGLPTKFWSPQRVQRELPSKGLTAQRVWQRIKDEVVDKDSASEIKARFGLVGSDKSVGVALSKIALVNPNFSKKKSHGKVGYTLGGMCENAPLLPKQDRGQSSEVSQNSELP